VANNIVKFLSSVLIKRQYFGHLSWRMIQSPKTGFKDSGCSRAIFVSINDLDILTWSASLLTRCATQSKSSLASQISQLNFTGVYSDERGSVEQRLLAALRRRRETTDHRRCIDHPRRIK